MNYIKMQGQICSGYQGKPALALYEGTSSNGKQYCFIRFRIKEYTHSHQSNPHFKYWSVKVWGHREYINMFKEGDIVDILGSLTTDQDKDDKTRYNPLINLSENYHKVEYPTGKVDWPAEPQPQQQYYQPAPAAPIYTAPAPDANLPAGNPADGGDLPF